MNDVQTKNILFKIKKETSEREEDWEWIQVFVYLDMKAQHRQTSW